MENYKEMSGLTIKDHLVSVALPPGVSKEKVDGAIRKMAERAKMRITFSECGGLPGPAMPLNRLQRAKRFLSRFF